LEKIKIMSNRYDVSSEIIIQAKRRGLKIGRTRAKCLYTKYAKTRGTTIVSGIRIFAGLIKLSALGAWK
jgi:hypothetical protein